jgi:hypothetical protein
VRSALLASAGVVGVAVAVSACAPPDQERSAYRPIEAEAVGTAEPVDVPAPTLVSLLERTRARVTVSSRVDNETDAPEHLLDGRLDTAWNSAPGDLGATITIEVPTQARVKRVGIVVGYDKLTPRGDLFLRNHRIRKVAIERAGGASVGVFTLDPSDRRIQTIDLDEPGGALTLRVLEADAGTEPRFREIVVSELTVFGEAPDEVLLPPAMPEVNVAGDGGDQASSAFASFFEGAPYPTSEALCAAFLRVSAKQIEEARATDPNVHLHELTFTPRCSVTTLVQGTTSIPSPLGLFELHGIEDLSFVDRLVVRTELGWFPTALVLQRSDAGPGCGHVSSRHVEQASYSEPGGGRVLAFDYVVRNARWMMASEPSFEVAARFRVACSVEAGRASCRRALVASSMEDLDWVSNGQQTGQYPPVPSRWEWTREATPQRGGAMRLGPCVDPSGEHVRCSIAVERKVDWL